MTNYGTLSNASDHGERKCKREATRIGIRWMRSTSNPKQDNHDRPVAEQE